MVGTIKRFLRMISPELRRRFFSVEVHALISALIDTLAFALLYPLLRVLTSYSKTASWVHTADNVLHSSTKGQLELRLSLLIVFFFILSSVVGLFLTKRQTSLVASIEEDLSTHLFRRYMDEPYLSHTSRNSSELIRNAYNLPADMSTGTALPILQLTQNVLVILLMVVLIAVVNPIVVGASVIYFGLGVYIYAKVVAGKATAAGKRLLGVAGICIKLLQEGFGGLKSYRSSGATSVIVNAYEQERHELAKLRYKVTLYSQLPQYYLQSVMIGGMILFVLIVSQLHSSDATALVGLVVAVFLRLFPALYASLNSTSKLRATEGGVDELYEEISRMSQRGPAVSNRRSSVVVREEVEEVASAECQGSGHLRLDWHSRIRFCDVEFKYPRSSTQALKHLSFDIPKGSFVGIVGPSGAGKTTIVDLLLGLFLPTAGGVFVDDEPLRGPVIERWRKCVGYVPQEGFLIDGSVRENLLFGSANVDDDRYGKHMAHSSLKSFRLLTMD